MMMVVSLSFRPLWSFPALLESKQAPALYSKKKPPTHSDLEFCHLLTSLHFQIMNLIMGKSQSHPLWRLSNCQRHNGRCDRPRFPPAQHLHLAATSGKTTTTAASAARSSTNTRPTPSPAPVYHFADNCHIKSSNIRAF